MEVEKDQIIKKLETEVHSIRDYDTMNKYCINLNENIQGIWKKLECQQQNAELLEDNLYEMKKEDFFKMWACYGIPRIIFVKKSEVMFELDKKRKDLKSEQKTEYKKTLQDISNLKNDYETNLLINNTDNYERNYEIFSDLNFKIDKMIKHCALLNEYQVIVGFKTPTDFSEIKEIYNSFINYYNLWDSVYKFLNSKEEIWMKQPLKKINRKDLKATYDSCTGMLDKLEKTIFRRDKPNPWQVIQQTKEHIKDFQPILPVLYDLVNPDLK